MLSFPYTACQEVYVALCMVKRFFSSRSWACGETVDHVCFPISWVATGSPCPAHSQQSSLLLVERCNLERRKKGGGSGRMMVRERRVRQAGELQKQQHQHQQQSEWNKGGKKVHTHLRTKSSKTHEALISYRPLPFQPYSRRNMISIMYNIHVFFFFATY